MIFKDRIEAGKSLAEKLTALQIKPPLIVLGLPRGGVIVAHEIAQKLKAPLDIIVPRKIGAPFSPELAIGAITEDGSLLLNQEMVKSLRIEKDYIDQASAKEKKEAQRRLNKYRAGRASLDLKDKTVIITDDGIATGATMQAALRSIRSQNAKKIIVAVPVLPPDTKAIIEKECDELVFLGQPADFGAIGMFYEKFDQTTDEEVIAIMKKY